MKRLKRSGALLIVLSFAALLHHGQLAAQQTSACVSTEATEGPPRQVIRCGDAITFEREAGAALQIIERPGSDAPETIELRGGAILIEVTPGIAPTQIRTPHAIATVRGTIYMVDVSQDETSVFVIEGSVIVRKIDTSSAVTLEPGEGVDVAPDRPLEVKTWGAARVAALLARFGR